MPTRRTSLNAPQAARLMLRLCKHFALKTPVVFDTHQARIDFPLGQCRIVRRDDALEISCSAIDSERLRVLEKILADHVALMTRPPIVELEWAESEPR